MNEGQPIPGGQPVTSGGSQPITSGQSFVPASPAPISSGTGDIVLSSSEGKKSRKGLVIAILVSVALVVVGVVAILTLNNSGSRLNSTFEKYKKLVLFGTNPEISYPNEDGLYAIQVVKYNENQEEVEKYFDEIRTLQVNLLSTLEGTNTSLRNMLLQNTTYLSIWMDVVSFYNFYDKSTVTIYETEGYAAAEEYINDKYADFIDSENILVDRMGNLLIEMQTEYLVYVDRFETNGCKLSEISDECEDREEVSNLVDSMEKVDELSGKALELSWGLLRIAVNEVLSEKI